MYAQPEDYHFCQDSIIAPRLIAADLGSRAIKRALDVCAGCGVMGFELTTSVEHFDFMDIQTAFEPYFRANQKQNGRASSWICANFTELATPNFANRYDLIIANPPYFLRSESSLSAIELNNRARFFLDGDLRQLLKGIRNALTPDGVAYILMKTGKEHGRDAFTSARIELFDCKVERLADVRGTNLVKISKL